MDRWHALWLVAASVVVTYPENRSEFWETVPRPLTPRVPLRGNSPFTCYHRHILFTPRTPRRTPSVDCPIARSRGLQRQVTALPPIELDGSSSEDEDQARDEKTEIHRRDQDQAPRHHTTVSTTPIDPTQYHRRRAGQFASSGDSDVKCYIRHISLNLHPLPYLGSASSRMYPDTCAFSYLQQRAHHYLFLFRNNLCLSL